MHDALGEGRLRLLDHDIAILAVTAVGRERDSPPVAGPAGLDVARLAVGETDRLRLRVGGVLEVELEVLVAADVGRIEQQRAAGLHLAALHRLDAARQGDTLRERRGHRVEVRRVADAGGHDCLSARGVPAAEARAPEVEVGRQFGGQRRGDVRHAFGDDVGRHRGQADGDE